MLVQKTIEGLREEQVDIRKFPLKTLSIFINYVSIYEPTEMQVFFKYIMMAFDSGYFKVSQTNFMHMSQIFNMFVKDGYLGPS